MAHPLRPLLLLLLPALLLPVRQSDPPPDAELVVRQVAPDEQADYLTLETAFTPPDDALPVAAEYQFGGQKVSAELVDAGPEPFYVALLIDTSGSMSPVLESTRRAATALVEAAPPQAYFAVITFDSTLNKQLDFSNDRAAVAGALTGLQSNDGSTCLYDAVHATLAALARFWPTAGATPATAAARRAVVVFSDGRDELRDDQPQACSRLGSIDVAAANAALGIPVHTVYAVGLAPGRAEQMVALARAGGGGAATLTAATLPDFFNAIITSFTRQWRATARFYIGPAGRHMGQLVATLNNGRYVQAAVSFDISRPHLPPPLLTLHDIDYQEATQRLRLSFSFLALPAVDALRVEIIDRAGTTPTIEETLYIANFSPGSAHTLPLPVDLQRNHAYQVRLTALAAGRPILIGDNQTVSAERLYFFQPSPPPLVNLRIEGLTLSPWQPGRPQTLTAQLSATTFTPIAVLDGYLVRQPDRAALQELYRFETPVAGIVTTPLVGGGGRYTLVLIARTAQGDYLGTAVHEFDTSDYWLERGWQALAASPWLLALAVLPSLLVLLLVSLTSARRPHLRSDYTEPEEPTATPAGPRLRIEASPQATLIGQLMPLASFPFTIGREGCSLNLPDDKQLSRRHTQITMAADNALYLSDLSSGHGTFLDGRRLADGELALLAAQRSIIQVGKATTLVFEQEV